MKKEIYDEIVTCLCAVDMGVDQLVSRIAAILACEPRLHHEELIESLHQTTFIRKTLHEIHNLIQTP
jgi:hypothetical protein